MTNTRLYRRTTAWEPLHPGDKDDSIDSLAIGTWWEARMLMYAAREDFRDRSYWSIPPASILDLPEQKALGRGRFTTVADVEHDGIFYRFTVERVRWDVRCLVEAVFRYTGDPLPDKDKLAYAIPYLRTEEARNVHPS